MAYEGFKALVKKGVPPGAAANIGRKKYGKAKFQKAAAEGKKMKGMKPLKRSKMSAGDQVSALKG